MATFRHGMTGSRFYNTYMGMKMRCYNTNEKSFPDYGGRGIIVCEEWRNDFINFMNDMHESYLKHIEEHGEKNTTIERKNVDGNYDANNCTWATRKTQNNNNRKNKRYDYKEQLLTITQICELEGRSDAQFVYRRVWAGWDLERALNTSKLEGSEAWKERKTHGRPKKVR